MRDALEGNQHGLSGREALGGASRYYFIARSYSGESFDPVRIVAPWAAAERLVKRSGDLGQSVFIGLPRWEDRLQVAHWSNLTLPEESGDGARHRA